MASWQYLPIGNGGLINNLRISADGTMFCGCDSSGAFKWNTPDTNRWNQLVNTTALPGKIVEDFAQGFGCDGITIDSNNQNIVWWLMSGRLRYSTDKGTTFTEDTSYSYTDAVHGGTSRVYGPRLAVDPYNSNVVYASTPFSGMRRTTVGVGGFTAITNCSAGHTEGAGNIYSGTVQGTSTTSRTAALGSLAFTSNIALNMPASASRAVIIQSRGGGPQMIGTCPLGSSGTSFTFNCLDFYVNGGGARTDWDIYLIPGDQRENQTTTDTSTVTVGTGTKTFNNLLSAYSSAPSSGTRICIWKTDDPTIQMYGTVNAATTTTSLVLDVTSSQGSGSQTGWTIGATNYEGGGHMVCFDTSAGSVSTSINGFNVTRCKNIYVGTWGVGVYFSGDGGLTWTFLNFAGMPRYPKRMACDLQGALWVTDGQHIYFSTNAFKYSGGSAGTWSPYMHISGGGVRNYNGVAVDYLNSGSVAHVCFGAGGGPLLYTSFSVDAGSTWNETNANTFVSSGDVDWILAWLNSAYGFFGCEDIYFDPIVSGKLWVAAEGVWYCTPPASGSGTSLTITQQTRGVEMFINICILSTTATPGGVIVGTWDFPGFYTENFNAYPLNYNYTTSGNVLLSRTYSIDWLYSDPSKVAAVIQDGSGFSNNASVDFSGVAVSGGKAPSNWTPFTGRCNTGAVAGGHIAYSSLNDILVIPTQNASTNVPAFSRNGGTSWPPISLPGGTPSTGWGASTNSRPLSKTCDSDKANGDIYIYNWSYDGAGGKRIYKWTRATDTWSICAAAPATSGSNFINEKLKCVPGQAGHSFFTDGQEAGTHPIAAQLFIFTNDGWATKSTVPNWQEVHAFGFGATFAGQSYPAIYAVGWYSGVYGIYRCKNWNPSNVSAGIWTALGTPYPKNIIGYIVDIDGDKATAGTVYALTNGFGAFYWADDLTTTTLLHKMKIHTR